MHKHPVKPRTVVSCACRRRLSPREARQRATLGIQCLHRGW